MKGSRLHVFDRALIIFVIYFTIMTFLCGNQHQLTISLLDTLKVYFLSCKMVYFDDEI